MYELYLGITRFGGNVHTTFENRSWVLFTDS